MIDDNMIEKNQYEVVTRSKEDGSYNHIKFWEEKVVKTKFLFFSFNRLVIEDDPDGYYKAIKLAKSLWQSNEFQDVIVRYIYKDFESNDLPISCTSWENGRFT